MKAGNLFQNRGPTTSNDLSISQVLVHGMTNEIKQQTRVRLC